MIRAMRRLSLAAALLAPAAPAAADDAAGPVLRGTVVDEKGLPVAGALVRAKVWRQPTREARSGADGGFAVRADGDGAAWTSIEARTDAGDRIGLTTVVGRYVGPAEPVKIVLKPPRALTVRVRDAAGKPVAGAGVSVDTHTREVEPATTDAEGIARFVVPADAQVKTVSALKDGVGIDYFENYRQAPTPPFAPPPAEVALTLDGAKLAIVTVVDGDGKPVPGAELGLHVLRKRGKLTTANPVLRGVATARTGPDGVARLRWLGPTDGGYVVLFSPGYSELEYASIPSTARGDVSATIHALRDGRISGRVTRADGSPARGVRVRAEGHGRSVFDCRRWTRTGDDGTYSLDVSTGDSYLVSIIEAEYAATPHQGVIIKEGQVRDGLDFRLTEGTRLHGRLLFRRDLELERPPMVTVVLQGGRLPGGFQSNPDGDAREQLYFWIVPDAEGRYEVRLGRGEYEITGLFGRTPETIRVDGTGEVVRDLKGPEPVLVDVGGSVVDAATKRPVAGAVVRILPSGPDSDERRPVVAGADGKFVARRRLDETTLIATAADGSRAAVLAVQPGAKGVTIVLTPAATVSGRVLDASGRPVARANVYVRSSLADAIWPSCAPEPAPSPGGPVLTRTGHDGRFHVDGLIPGARCEVRALVDGPDRIEHRTLKVFAIAGPGPIDLGDLTLPGPVRPRRPSAADVREAHRPPLPVGHLRRVFARPAR